MKRALVAVAAVGLAVRERRRLGDLFVKALTRATGTWVGAPGTDVPR